MTDLPENLTLAAPARPVFDPHPLPWLARLARRALTPYRNRWVKRLLKRPTRTLFDMLHDGLGLDCRITVRTTIGGEQRAFRCTLRQLHFLHSWGLYGAVYEPEVSALLDHLIRFDDVVYDVGANWGYFAIRAAAVPGFQGTVHAFEPMPGTAADARMAVDHLGLGNHVHVHELALSDTNTTLRMATEDAKHTGIARVVDGHDENTHAVSAKRMDDLDLPPPDIMKMDIEGHEHACLTGAADTLRTHHPTVVFESWYSESEPEWRAPLQTLNDAGYTLYDPALNANGTHLSLTRFRPDDRPTLATHINILAIHPTRFKTLGL